MKTKGMTVLYWLHGNKVSEYHKDAVKVGCKFYTGEQFDVLFNKDNQILMSCPSAQLIGVEHHGETK